jgi:hypothetical protein
MHEQRCTQCGQVMTHMPEFGHTHRQAVPPTPHAQRPPGPTIELHKNGAAAPSRPPASQPLPATQSVVQTQRWDLNARPSFVHYAGLNIVCVLFSLTWGVLTYYALESVPLRLWVWKHFGWTPSSYATLFFSFCLFPLVYMGGRSLELRSRAYTLAADGRHLLIISGVFFRRVAQVDLLHVVNITSDRPLLYKIFTLKADDVCDVLLFIRPPNGTEDVVVIPALHGGSLLKERFTQHIIALRRLFSRPR